jgi:hypothetical protein
MRWAFFHARGFAQELVACKIVPAGEPHYWRPERNLRRRDDLFYGRIHSARFVSMAKARSMPIPRIHGPLAVAMAVAAFGIGAMLLVDHGPWNKPHLRTALVNYGTTSAAARAAGARVTPTLPKPAIEPAAPGPKPAQPANDVPL